MLKLDKTSGTPLYEQIYEQLVEGIANSEFPPGSKIPSIRHLADALQCSCNTVSAAYKLLIQEGFLVSKPGSGFYVTEDLLLLDRIKLEYDTMEDRERDDGDDVSARVHNETLRDDGGSSLGPVLFDFTYRDLEPGSFPSLEWKALADDVLLSPIAVACNFYMNSEGEPHLREEIARHIALSRGMHCEANQIIIQSGTQPALQNLLMLFDPTIDSIAMENPGYVGARSAFERCRFRIIPCPVVDDEANFADAVVKSGARLAYTTPSNQFPMGTVMSASTRHRLLEWAHKTDAYIIEDDYCHELDFQNEMHPALGSLDEHGRVIYMGTFSKSLSPALRINYLVLPPSLLERWKKRFEEAYPAVNWLTQEILARYLESDRYSRHIRRMLLRNKRKYEVLQEALSSFMGDRIDIIEAGAGLHMLIEVKGRRSQSELIDLARSVGVKVYGTDKYWMTHPHPLKSCILIGFSSISEELIRPGIERLAQAWFGA